MILRHFLPRGAGLLVLATLAGSAAAVEVAAAWARPTAPGAKVGSAYMVLHGGAVDDRLLGGGSPRAGAVELHTHVMEGGVARMRAVPAIEVPAGGRVELKPGGLHLMLIDLKAPLRDGEVIPLKLRFAKTGEVALRVAVGAAPASADGPPHHHAGH